MFRLSRIGMLLPSMILLSSIMGCATFHSPFAKKNLPKATAADPAMEIVCLWQPGEGSDPDGVPCRGFMGQIMFLSQSSSTPVQIEGEVRIYLFDDQGTQEEQSKPLRMFNFDNGSWGIHLTDSSFGPTYQVFVPYVRRGTSNANCSLRVRLKPKQGPVIFSEFTNMPLNGHKKTLRDDEAKPIKQEEVDRLAADAMSTDLRRTTTISLGSNPKATDAPAAAKQNPNAGKIQQAAYEAETDPAPQNLEADRIRRLETMLQQLLEQKNQVTGMPSQAPLNRPMMNQNRQELEPPDATNSRERINMTPRKRIRLENKEETPPKAPRRLSHPLEEARPYDSEALSTETQQHEIDQESPLQSSGDSIEPSPRFNLQGERNR